MTDETAFGLIPKSARIIDPPVRLDAAAYVAPKSGKIACVGPDIAGAAEKVDISSRLVFPGAIRITDRLSEGRRQPRR